MAAFAAQGQTIAALIEVGDRVRNGEHPDDFMTVKAVYPRSAYVKLDLVQFDNTVQTVRIGNTELLHILTFEIDEPVVLDADVTECKGKLGLCGNTETLEDGYCMFCREEGEGS